MITYHPALIQNLGTQELFLIAIIVLLLFGAKRLPELFRSFGKSIKEFKRATSDIEDDIRTAMEPEVPGSGQFANNTESAEPPQKPVAGSSEAGS